jgi:hypothetical protein
VDRANAAAFEHWQRDHTQLRDTCVEERQFRVRWSMISNSEITTLVSWIPMDNDLFFMDEDFRTLVVVAYETGALSLWALGHMLEHFVFKARPLIPTVLARLIVPPRDVEYVE